MSDPELGPADDQPAAAPEVEVHYRTPAHGVGLLRVGNPGNVGGRSFKRAIKQELRRILDEHGLPFLERVVRRQEVEFKLARTVVGHTDKGMPIVSDQLVPVPASIADATRAVAVALVAAETKPATERPGLARKTVLRVIVAAE